MHAQIPIIIANIEHTRQKKVDAFLVCIAIKILCLSCAQSDVEKFVSHNCSLYRLTTEVYFAPICFE